MRRLSAALLVIAMGLGIVVGEVTALRAETQPKPCEKNACQGSVGNCDLVTHLYNCTETVEAPGCKDTACT
jgi:hypothetical protein